jgi:integration host factor subunit beta
MDRQTVAKRTIAERISDKLHIGQTQTLQVLQAFLEEIIEELAQGNRLEFRDFGVFETVERKPRMALNPKTLEKVPVGRKIVVKFKVGRLMKAKVAELGERLMAEDRAKLAAQQAEANGTPPATG